VFSFSRSLLRTVLSRQDFVELYSENVGFLGSFFLQQGISVKFGVYTVYWLSFLRSVEKCCRNPSSVDIAEGDFLPPARSYCHLLLCILSCLSTYEYFCISRKYQTSALYYKIKFLQLKRYNSDMFRTLWVVLREWTSIFV
jgi:hypothetical protein